MGGGEERGRSESEAGRKRGVKRGREEERIRVRETE